VNLNGGPDDCLLKEFGSWAERMTEQLKDVSCQAARDQNRPIVYVPRADTDRKIRRFGNERFSACQVARVFPS
jgi:hypothetical protein